MGVLLHRGLFYKRPTRHYSDQYTKVQMSMIFSQNWDNTSSYLTTLHINLAGSGGYRFARLPFSVGPVDEIFQQKIEETLKDLLNVLGSAHDILIVGYDMDSRDPNRMLRQVIHIFHWENLRLNKNKCHFKCIRVPFFGKRASRQWVLPDSWKLHMLTEMPPFSNRKELQSLLGVLNYLGKIYLPLRKYMSH